ncbi:hypothetical protein GCM10023317_44260 [Actinopolymorpha pittospori]
MLTCENARLADTPPGGLFPRSKPAHPPPAAAAADTFADRLATATLELSDVICDPSSSFNLAAAAAAYAGLAIASVELRTPVKVYRTRPADP